MTGLERLREAISGATGADDEHVIAGDLIGMLLDLAEAVQRWRRALCTSPRPSVASSRDGDPVLRCYGDNHVDGCPVERARQDVIHTSNKLESL